jgi:hypothetical protein
MSRSLGLVVAIALLSGTLLSFVDAGEAPDNFVGTWVYKAKAGGHDQYWDIAHSDGKWTVQGTYRQGDKETGSFVSTDVKFAAGVLTYTHKYVKKPASGADNVPAALKVSGDKLSYSWGTDYAKGPRLLTRVAARAAANEVPAKEEAKSTQEPKTAAKEQAQKNAPFAGTWKGIDKDKLEEVWTIASAGGDWQVTGVFRKGGKQVGAAHGAKVETTAGQITFTRVWDKKPIASAQDNAACTFKPALGEMTIRYKGGTTRKLALQREGPAVAKAPDGKATAGTMDEKYAGVWTGVYPGTSYGCLVGISHPGMAWSVEVYLTGGDGSLIAGLKQPNAFVLAPQRGLQVAADWQFRPNNFKANAPFNLIAQPPELRMELLVAGQKNKPASDLKRGSAEVLAALAKSAAPKMAAAPAPAERGKPTPAPLPAVGAADERAAADAVRRAGGEIKIDEKAPDKHVDGVIFNQKKSSPAGLAHLSAFKQLRWVSLGTAQFDDACLQHVAKIPTIRVLQLGNSGVTAAGLKLVGEMSDLEHLNLRRTAVTDDGMTALKKLSKLRYLDAAETKITDAGLKELKGLRSLETLYLIGTNISDAGLNELKALPNLQTLNVLNAKKVTKAGVHDFEKARPKVSLVYRFK